MKREPSAYISVVGVTSANDKINIETKTTLSFKINKIVSSRRCEPAYTRMNVLTLYILGLLVVLVTSVHENLVPKDDNEDYYWKDYTGAIPDCALPGGVDKNGKPTYVGQVLHGHTIVVPGEVDAHGKILRYTVDKVEYTTASQIKVLCARSPEQYEWIDTNSKQIRFLANKRHLITGGYKKEFPYAIGRIKCENRAIVGKIDLYSKDLFTFVLDDNDECNKGIDFQVLTYNPVTTIRVVSKRIKPGCDDVDRVYNINLH